MFLQSHIIKLTMAVYKVSDFFPEREPLKVLIKQKADEILAGLILQEKDIEKHIEVMRAYIELSCNLGLAKKEYLEVLGKEYGLIADNLKVEKKEEPISAPVELRRGKEEAKVEVVLNGRHRKIIDILKKGKPIQVKDLKNTFPNISKRTLRRDFEYLLDKGLVDRIGNNNNTEYKLKSARTQ
ncbi:MAG: DeoR family transcriptional regulator [bacterium]